MMVEEITIKINLPKLTDYENCKPMLKHICSVVTRETGVNPVIECMGIKK